MKTTSVLICLSFLAFAALANALPRPAERQLLGSDAADEKVPEHTPSLKPPKNAQKSAKATANVILLGESGVGKTALFNYLLRKGPPTHADHYSNGGTIAVPKPIMITSIGGDGDHHAEDLPFPLKLWDTGAGDPMRPALREGFKNIAQSFVREAEIAVVMFDASDTTGQSWATALEWIGYAKQHGASAIMIIATNKALQATPEQLMKVQQTCQALMKNESGSRIIAAWTLMDPSRPLKGGLVNAIRSTLQLAAAHRAWKIASEPTNCTGTDCASEPTNCTGTDCE